MQVKIAKGKNLIKFSFILIKEFRFCSEIDTLLNKKQTISYTMRTGLWLF